VLACRNRDDLAAWVDRVWADDTSDPIRTRVAEEVDRFLAVGDTGSLRAWFDLRHPFDDLEPDDSGAVSVLTFHAAKGREWSAVLVTGVEAGLVPHNGSTAPAQRAEEARLLHVALTRASEDLVVTWAASRGGAPTQPSPWVEALEAAIVAQPPAGPSPLVRVRRPTDPLEPLRNWRAAVARRAGVADSAVCPDRVLRSLHTDPPADAAAVAARLGIGLAAAERLAPELLDALSRRPGRVAA
jgi:DNA helicase-2/ATP-dependent DNA helicase PcrA